MEIARAILAGLSLTAVVMLAWWVVLITIIDVSQLLDKRMRGIDGDKD